MKSGKKSTRFEKRSRKSKQKSRKLRKRSRNSFKRSRSLSKKKSYASHFRSASSIHTKEINSNLYFKNRERVVVVPADFLENIREQSNFIGIWKQGIIHLPNKTLSVAFKYDYDDVRKQVIPGFIQILVRDDDQYERTVGVIELQSFLETSTQEESRIIPTQFEDLTQQVSRLCILLRPFKGLTSNPVSKEQDPSKLFYALSGCIFEIAKECVECRMESKEDKYIYPYFRNFYFLMYLIFVLELCYCLIFSFSKGGLDFYDTVGNTPHMQGDECKGIFTQDRRYYRNELARLSFEQIFNKFTAQVDTIFTRFVDELVHDLHTKTNTPVIEIRRLIYQDGDVSVNWKENLAEKQIRIDVVNRALTECLTKIASNLEDFYSPEGLGFFSYTFLVKPEISQQNFGSCITYSCIELYIMSRMKINPSNIFLVLEREQAAGQSHPYWEFTQEYLGMPISHWATEVELSKQGNRTNTDVKTTTTFRSYVARAQTFNLENDKESIIMALTLPIFDSYRLILRKCFKIRPEFVKEYENFVSSIGQMFLQYNEKQETSIKNYLTSTNRLNDLEHLQVKFLNKEYTVPIHGKEVRYNLLYSACLKGDTSVVEFICKVYGTNLELKNQNGNTCVHAAVLGVQGGSNTETASNRIRCLSMLKDALKTKWRVIVNTTNNRSETPYHCIQYGGFTPDQKQIVNSILKS